jgi:hypothetical protein
MDLMMNMIGGGQFMNVLRQFDRNGDGRIGEDG